MAPLPHTLALLAMTVATAAIKEVPLDMARDSFDDQYQGCGPEMTAALPAFNHSKFQKNPLFARVWVKAKAEWQSQGSRVSPLSSPDQAIAIMAYTMPDVHRDFNAAVRPYPAPSSFGEKPHYEKPSVHKTALKLYLNKGTEFPQPDSHGGSLLRF
uniref:NAD(P)(+)--arginine ADP-ribosyltransferase n=1 Tax=Zosterops lateralis melanops TaxID=1220523 RepID=A0A8D2PW97_ZOSLA